MMMMMKSVESVRLLVILEVVLGKILKGVVCRCRWSVFSSWLCCSLLNPMFSCLLLTNLSHLLRVQLHFWSRPSTTYRNSLFSLILQFSIISFCKYWCALITCPKYRIFSIFVMAFNEIFGLTFCKISLFVFLFFHDILRILRRTHSSKAPSFFYPSFSWSIFRFHMWLLGKTKISAIFILIFIFTFLTLRILSNFDKADFLIIFPLLNSFVHLPSLVTSKPKKM